MGMEIAVTGYCEDCDCTVDIEFDEDDGCAPYCVSCGGYEVEVEETVESDGFEDFEDIDFDEDEDDEDGLVIDDEF